MAKTTPRSSRAGGPSAHHFARPDPLPTGSPNRSRRGFSENKAAKTHICPLRAPSGQPRVLRAQGACLCLLLPHLSYPQGSFCWGKLKEVSQDSSDTVVLMARGRMRTHRASPFSKNEGAVLASTLWPSCLLAFQTPPPVLCKCDISAATSGTTVLWGLSCSLTGRALCQDPVRGPFGHPMPTLHPPDSGSTPTAHSTGQAAGSEAWLVGGRGTGPSGHPGW